MRPPPPPPPPPPPQTAIGHWSEMLFPLFSILRQERNFSRPPTQFLLLHLKRCHVMEWVRANLATALGVGPDQHLPPIIWQQEVGQITDQLCEWWRVWFGVAAAAAASLGAPCAGETTRAS